MKKRRAPIETVVFIGLGLGWLAGGCGADGDEGNAADVDAYDARSRAAAVPVDPGDRSPQWIVRTVDPEASAAGRHLIEDVAVAGGYVYFAVAWEGIYRTPLAGGRIEVVDTGTKRRFDNLAVNQTDVFWSSTRFGEADYPFLRVRRQLATGGPTQTLINEQQLSIPSSSLDHFQANASAVVMIAGPNGAGARFALRRVTAAEGTVTSVLPVTEVVLSPSWVLDDTHVFFVPVGSNQPESLFRVGVGGGTPELVAPLPASDAELGALDATHVYLTSGRSVLKVDRTTGTTTTLVETTESLYSQLALDDRNAYFITNVRPAPLKVHAVPKAGGPPVVIGELEPRTPVVGMTQDGTDLYIFNSREIRVLRKPAPPPVD